MHQVRLDAAEMNETTVSGVTDAQIQEVLDQYENGIIGQLI